MLLRRGEKRDACCSFDSLCRNILGRGGRGWRERSPHTRLHSCSITVIWLTWTGCHGRRGERRGEERGSLLWEITHLISEWGKNGQIWWVVPLGAQPGVCGGGGMKETTRPSHPLHLPLLMTSASMEQYTWTAPICRSPPYSAFRNQQSVWKPAFLKKKKKSCKKIQKSFIYFHTLDSFNARIYFNTFDFHTFIRV